MCNGGIAFAKANEWRVNYNIWQSHFLFAQVILFFQSFSSLIKSVGLGEESCSLAINMVFFKEKKAKENSLLGMLTLKMVVGKIWSFNLFLKLQIIFGVSL